MNDPERRRPGEIVFALATVVFSVAAFRQSFAISGLEGPSEPGVFPMLASATMLVASLAILRSAAFSRAAPEERSVAAWLSAIMPLRLVFLVALVAGYVVMMPVLGFVAGSALFLFMSLWLLWRRGPLRAAAVAALSLGVIWVVFRAVFQVLLPSGTLLSGLF